jgi:4-amino-4-deoxy-L-arabinose transferase
MDYFEKPVLGYWAIATSMSVFGETPFAARLPSAIGIALSALALLYLLRRRDDTWLGPLAALILLTSLGVIALGTTAILDGFFTGWVTLAIASVFVFLEGPDDRRALTPLILTGVATGLAFLTKGFLALVIPALAVGPYLIIRRSVLRFLRWSWVPLVAATAVALPWSLAVARQSDFWTYFFWVEHVQRFLEPAETQHVEPWWYYLPAFLLMVLPWITAAPTAISGLRRIETSTHRRLRLFAFCWMAGPLLFFSVSSGKLIPYILPCIPPAALLLAIGLRKETRSGHQSSLTFASIVSAGIGVILVGAVLVLMYGRTDDPNVIAIVENRWLLGGLLTGALGWPAAAGASLFFKDHTKKLVAFALSPVLFTIPVLLTLDEPLVKTPENLIERHRNLMGPDTIIVGDRNTVQALCWQLKRTDIEVFGSAGEFQYGLDQTDGRQLLDIGDLSHMVTSSSVPVIAVLERGQWERSRTSLPTPLVEDGDRRFVLVNLTSDSSVDRMADSHDDSPRNASHPSRPGN